MHELCYATSKDPRQGFTYGGVIVSNCDLHIGDEPDLPKACLLYTSPSQRDRG